MKKKKIQKFREIIAYIIFGFILALDVYLLRLLIIYRAEYFNFAIDFSRSIELGILVMKLILLIVLLVMNLKSFQAVNRQWRKETFIEKEEKREGTIEYKRMGLIRRLIFYWKVNGARKWMDKYHEYFKGLQKYPLFSLLFL